MQHSKKGKTAQGLSPVDQRVSVEADLLIVILWLLAYVCRCPLSLPCSVQSLPLGTVHITWYVLYHLVYQDFF